MKAAHLLMTSIVGIGLFASGCKSLNKTQKGTAIGAAGGAAVGAVVGKIAGNTALGAILGAAVGGTTGLLIGKKMDKQAEEIKKEIPNATVERIGEGIVVEFDNKILFTVNSSDLSSIASTDLNDLVTILNKYPGTNIEVQGHTDNTGSSEYNQALSEKRAASVSSYILGKGIASARIATKGFGETSPKFTNETEEGRAHNRRVDFLIVANEEMKAEANQQASAK